MNILVAFDKFKDSMTAVRACDAAANGAQRALDGEVIFTRAPLTDGGEGFCRILTEAASGHIEYYPVTGPLGEEIDAPLGWIESDKIPTRAREILGLPKGNVAVIEMAAVAGLELVPNDRRHPGQCTTRGVGELIRSAVAKEASAILLGIGGSATSDLGLGALEALGIQFPGTEAIFPSQWDTITAIAGQLDCVVPPVYIACDVDNPLLGPKGAASVYGPQKGLEDDEITAFDARAAKMAELLCQHFGQPSNLKDIPGSGAAGGIGFGLKVACGAEFVPGFELVAAWLDISGKVAEADLVLTGEGKFDASSLAGKGPYSLLAAAHAADKPAILLAGCVEASAVATARERFPETGFYGISPKEMELEEALLKGPEHLEFSVETILSQLSEG
ncbi:glycerate kinase [Coraliomargarita sinensis]|uniref:Glycerate kinase n=1 Tax=Coraliomargarita sinensis TaxID=2174842 RepID=A0A317ZDF7_9BACT|nr:glycerate kinase [Coraliomargarita sinensis]PXA03315.1 glycerate kinase [Coraliomargarita sinensis]